MAITKKERLKTVFELLKKPKTLSALLSLNHTGYLKDNGWFNSFENQIPINSKNEPIPWTTYSFIDFVKPRLNKQMNIFEYGSGYSTLFFAKHVKKVTSVEHDEKWFKKLKNQIPPNAVIFIKSISDFVESIADNEEKYDLIFIDGEERVSCLKKSVSHITSNGVIILDDSERIEYLDGVENLLNNSFKRIDFWGISPGCLYKKCTTIFYRTENCLCI